MCGLAHHRRLSPGERRLSDRETYSDILSYRYVLELPQITDAEESDEDDGVEYDFR